MNRRDRDPFFQYPRTVASTSEGEIDMPVLYYDCSQVMGFFWVDPQRAQAQISPGLKVARFGGKALAVVAFYEYRESTLGFYREVGTAVACCPEGCEPPPRPLLALLGSPDRTVLGFNVIDLPVTTPAACAAGRDLWSFPKFVTPIDFELKDGSFSGAVRLADRHTPICRFAGRAGLGIPKALLSLVAYSAHRGRMLRALADVRGRGRLCLPGSFRLDVQDTSHPMSRRIAELGLAGARPAWLMVSDQLQLRLNHGFALP